MGTEIKVQLDQHRPQFHKFEKYKDFLCVKNLLEVSKIAKVSLFL